MRNLWLVTRREFVSRLRSGAFITSTLILMLVFFGSTFLPVFFAGRSNAAPLEVTVLDHTGHLFAPLQQAVASLPQGEGQREIRLTEGSGPEEALLDAARQGEFGLLIIEGSFPGDLKARFLASSVGLLSDSWLVTRPLESIVRSARMEERGLPPEVAMEIIQPLQVEERQLTAGEERSQDQMFGAVMLALGAIMSVYMITIMNSQFVFQGVLEEKVSRVVEVMAAAVRPSEMMAGKVLGLGGLGLLQYAGMMLAWFGGNQLSAQMMAVPSGMVSPKIALLIMIFILLSYFLNSTLMAALGATISRMEDSQTVMTPVLILLMIPMFMLTPVMNDPNGTLATTLSMVPFWTPTLMLLRVMLGQVPAIQLWGSIGMLLLTTAGVAWASGRIYRAALLTFGTRPTMKQLWQYLRAG